ncbi:hypothetical protein [Streptomyces sp. 150FB]|uniref:hypothetical protein n=1 Tax=Streptomyces sp. 150FB TaxID=1576605 RepID=UPI001F2A4C3A|nr:hypothetical protein [Streptomyces sp. 150FB]
MRQRLKLVLVAAGVGLALTGFSSSHGHGHSHGSGGSGGGGGCSSSSTKNGTYHDTDYDSDDDYDDYDDDVSSSSGGTYTDDPATESPSATGDALFPDARVIHCVSPKKGSRKAVTYATIEVTGDPAAGIGQQYEVDLTVLGRDGTSIDSGSTRIVLDGDETKTVKVKMGDPGRVSRAKSCEAIAMAV